METKSCVWIHISLYLRTCFSNESDGRDRAAPGPNMTCDTATTLPAAMTTRFRSLTAAASLATAAAHGSMIMPPSRNSIDAELDAWSEGKHPDTGTIEPYNCGW